jgi:hypothetical protein
MATTEWAHTTVMLKEAVEALQAMVTFEYYFDFSTYYSPKTPKPHLYQLNNKNEDKSFQVIFII